MKNKSAIIFLIILLSIISVALILFMTFVINGKFKQSNIIFNHAVSNEKVIDEVYKIDFKKIDIKASASDIYVKKWASDQTKLIVYGDKENTKVSTSNNELKITSKEKSCVGICFNFKVSKIVLYLPNDYNKLIKVDNDYGDTNVENLLNAKVEITEDAGDVNIEAAKDMTVTNNYGDIVIGKGKSANIKASAGDIQVSSIDYIDAKCNYGDINIDKINFYSYITNDCGDIEIKEMNLYKNSHIINNLGDIEIGKTNKIYFDAKTDLGDIKINNNYNKSDVILKIKNDCGDIEVNN